MDALRTIQDRPVVTTVAGALAVGLFAGALQVAGLGTGPALVVALALLVPVANLSDGVVDVDAYLDAEPDRRVLADVALSGGAAIVAGLAVAAVLGPSSGSLAVAVPVAVVFLLGSGVFYVRAREYAVTR